MAQWRVMRAAHWMLKKWCYTKKCVTILETSLVALTNVCYTKNKFGYAKTMAGGTKQMFGYTKKSLAIQKNVWLY